MAINKTKNRREHHCSRLRGYLIINNLYEEKNMREDYQPPKYEVNPVEGCRA